MPVDPIGLIEDTGLANARKAIRSYYVDGFRMMSEYEGEKKGQRMLYLECERISNWLGDDVMHFGREYQNRPVFISIDSRTIVLNPLYKVFRSHTISGKAMLVYFLLLSEIARKGAVSKPDFHPTYHGAELSAGTVSSVTDELLRLGVIYEERGERKKRSFHAHAPLDPSWSEAIRFASNSMPLGVVGSTFPGLQPEKSYFRIKHHFIFTALDSDVLYNLLQAAERRLPVQMTVYQPKRAQSIQQVILPLRFLFSTANGRQHVMCWEPQRKQYVMIRLDNIESVSAAQECLPDTDLGEIQKNADDLLDHMWGTALTKGKKRTHLEMDIEIRPDEDHIRRRLEREKRCGQVTKADACTLRFTADVVDAVEMIPWIRTWFGRITRFECDDPRVKETLLQDIRSIYDLYGGEQDDKE